MNIVRLKPLDWWQSCAGLCVICGTPMGIEPERKIVKEKAESSEMMGPHPKGSTKKAQSGAAAAAESEEATQDAEDVAEESSSNELIQENFVRVGLFKYNLLGRMDRCHLIDAYTFLDSSSSSGFLKALGECRKLVTELGGDLQKDIEERPQIYDKASDYCQRVANKVLVPGCKACNLAMARHVAHGDVVYRCFPQSAELSVPELENSMSKNIKKGNDMKRVLQQIALYFRFDAGHWVARDEGEIMPLASLWRCVANLCLWGKGGMARHRLVAIFYAGVMLYERLKMKDVMLLVDWHMHVFRAFYMQAVPPATFFGMHHGQVAVSFDTTRKAGPVWCSLVEHHVQWAHDRLEVFLRTSVNQRQVGRFKDAVTLHVSTEKALFCYLCRRAGARRGVQSIMSFYMYNFKDPRAILLYTRGRLFMKDMMREVGREMMLSSPHRAAASALAVGGALEQDFQDLAVSTTARRGADDEEEDMVAMMPAGLLLE